jgi:hypothetical protein
LCADFEKQNYSFTQTEQDKRWFYEKDIELLKRYIQEKTGKKLKAEQKKNLIESIISEYEKEESERNGTTSVPMVNGTTSVPLVSMEEFQRLQEMFSIVVNEVQENKKALKEQKKELAEQKQELKEQKEKVEHQDQYIKDSIERRDKMLMEQIRAVREIATAKEKKGLVTKIKEFFGKK